MRTSSGILIAVSLQFWILTACGGEPPTEPPPHSPRDGASLTLAIAHFDTLTSSPTITIAGVARDSAGVVRVTARWDCLAASQLRTCQLHKTPLST